jgi:hypothetical protein
MVVLALALAVTAFSQDLNVSGEMKTGILWSKTEDGLEPLSSTTVPVSIGSKDDAGTGPGRFRINTNYFNSDIHIGFKFRLNWERWHDSNSQPYPQWSYAFGYGKFFDDQLTLSLGKMGSGSSPWGSGGPEKYKELEDVGTTGGMRFEYEPSFIPGLNVGFVLNGFNGSMEEWKEPFTIFHILEETVVGVSYTNDYFHARAAFRFDSEVDSGRGWSGVNGKQGGELVYRLEERVIKNTCPALVYWLWVMYKALA